MKKALIWLRKDLRFDDNPALIDAIEQGFAPVLLFIWAPEEEGEWASGAASRWWLHHSLIAFAKECQKRDLLFLIQQGSSERVLWQIAQDIRAEALFWNRSYEPKILERDARIVAAAKKWGIEVHTTNSALLYEPWMIETQQGKPFQVFTPFWKACLAQGKPPPPRKFPKKWPKNGENQVNRLPIDSLKLLPKISWDSGLQREWTPGFFGARKRLNEFLQKMAKYKEDRDFPAQEGTSRLSPHLHFGEIGPREVWEVCREKSGAEPFLRQLGWREFGYHLLYHFPKTPDQPLREAYTAFPWKKKSKTLESWQRGETGYPIVDAGMRQLWEIGWMHNRVRMIVGSFLVKDLLLHWIEGARWFWDTLVDADLANNTLGWQWIGGCGADAAPYFRIFNPVLQSRKFDPEGEYIRQWVPELQNVPNKWLHAPWEAPEFVLRDVGVTLGKTYPQPIVDHHKARQEALEAFAQIKSE